MLTAREAYENRLKEIGEERRALNDERLHILDALRKMDEVGGQDVHASNITGELRDLLGQMRELVPAVSVQDMIEYLVKTKLPDAAEQVRSQPEELPESAQKEIDAAKDREAAKQKAPSKESKKIAIPKSGKRRTEIITKIIRDFIADQKGEPVRVRDILFNLRMVHDIEYTQNALTGVLKNAMDRYPQIVKAGFGKYKYLEGVTINRQSEVFDAADEPDEDDAEASTSSTDEREYTLV